MKICQTLCLMGPAAREREEMSSGRNVTVLGQHFLFPLFAPHTLQIQILRKTKTKQKNRGTHLTVDVGKALKTSETLLVAPAELLPVTHAHYPGNSSFFESDFSYDSRFVLRRPAVLNISFLNHIHWNKRFPADCEERAESVVSFIVTKDH